MSEPETPKIPPYMKVMIEALTKGNKLVWAGTHRSKRPVLKDKLLRSQTSARQSLIDRTLNVHPAIFAENTQK